MASLKIVYGIDLGTTNSAITRFENGKAVVKKNSLQSDTTPSCVAFNKSGKVLVGARAHGQLEKDYALTFKKPGYKSNTFIEFKRLMGTDHTYECTNLGRSITPEELSAEVLKELRKNILDENVMSAVITVPAMFNNTQMAATKRAAEMAGFEQVELIQEPVAASIAYGLNSKMKNAYWVVFDFGGGTFDAALMRIQDGVMQAIDTAGNNKLGGKDIDKAILDEIIMPYLKSNYTLDNILAKQASQFANMWKPKAEEAKIGLSFNESVEIETDLGDDYGTDDLGEDLALSLTITQSQLERVSAPIYQKAIDITKELLRKNHIDGNSLGALILVGGPTHSPIIRRMLKEQVTPNVDTSIDPMTCVAAGAAIYGSTIDLSEAVADATRDRSKVQLLISYPSTTVEQEEWVSVALLLNKCDNFHEDCVHLEFARADGRFTSPQSIVNDDGDVISLSLVADKPNVFDIHCFDSRGNKLECEPNQITIIQGLGDVGSAVIGKAYGIGTTNEEGIEVFDAIPGLEKSRKLPATGKILNLRTQRDIRPGVLQDRIRITLYQMEESRTGVRVLYCEPIVDTFITGEDLPSLLSEGSVINLMLTAGKSGAIDKFEADIPVLNLVIDLTDRMSSSKTVARPSSQIYKEIADARQRVNELNNQALRGRLDIVEQRYSAAAEDRDVADSTFSELQSICRDIDHEFSLGAWERQEKRLKGMFNELSNDNNKYGNAETTALVNRLKVEMEKVIARQDESLARDLYDQMWNLDYRIAEVDFYIVWIMQWNRDFNKKGWTNRSRARELVDKGMQIINNNPTSDKLRPIAFEIRDLLPENQRPDTLGH